MKKSKVLFIAAMLAVAFIAYVVCVFVIFGIEDHNAVFWVSFGFAVAAFLTVTISVCILRMQGLRLRDWIFGFPIIKHGAVYLTLEIAVSIAFIALEKHIPFAVAFIAQFLILCVFLMFAISAFMAKETRQQVHDNVTARTANVKMLRAKSETLVDKCPDEETRRAFVALAEKIRFSDPVSSDALFDIENKISVTLDICADALDENNAETALKYCAKADKLMNERNTLCRTQK